MVSIGGGFEDAHIVSAGVRGDGKNTGNGCDCPENKLRLCWQCHRFIVHGIKGGWAKLLEVATAAGLGGFLTGAMKRARDHYQARCRGETECSANTKAGQAARARIAAAEAREEARK